MPISLCDILNLLGSLSETTFLTGNSCILQKKNSSRPATEVNKGILLKNTGLLFRTGSPTVTPFAKCHTSFQIPIRHLHFSVEESTQNKFTQNFILNLINHLYIHSGILRYIQVNSHKFPCSSFRNKQNSFIRISRLMFYPYR